MASPVITPRSSFHCLCAGIISFSSTPFFFSLPLRRSTTSVWKIAFVLSLALSLLSLINFNAKEDTRAKRIRGKRRVVLLFKKAIFRKEIIYLRNSSLSLGDSTIPKYQCNIDERASTGPTSLFLSPSFPPFLPLHTYAEDWGMKI